MQKQQKRYIWLDTDPGQDDFNAVVLACSHPDIKLVGLSSVFGNTTIENTTRNLNGILALLNLENKIPIFRGAYKPLERDEPQDTDFHGVGGLQDVILPKTSQIPIQDNILEQMSKLILEQDQKVNYISVGPYTNLAQLLQKYPETKKNMDGITLMGGDIYIGNVTPTSEFNVVSDPEAAQYM